MTIKSLTSEGFRGFNEARTIQFDNALTLIAAHNSYGKTSISEAFEWLLYGQTSKVQAADSKDEYKGSYRNIHFPAGKDPCVSLVLDLHGSEHVLKASLIGDDIKRFLNGNDVADWPFADQMKASSKPFILQHALKNLLLATPVNRFASFAELLGFEALGELQKEIVAFCTKPNPPREVLLLQNRIAALEDRLTRSTLRNLAKVFKKGSPEEIFATTVQAARAYADPGTPDDSLLPHLVAKRDDAVSKIFKGSVAVAPENPGATPDFSTEATQIPAMLSGDFVVRYVRLIATKAQQRLSDTLKFFDLGLLLAGEEFDKCPFCGQEMTTSAKEHLESAHSTAKREQDATEKTATETAAVEAVLTLLDSRVRNLCRAQTGRVSNVVSIKDEQLAQLRNLLSKSERHYDTVAGAREQLVESEKKAQDTIDDFSSVLEEVRASIRTSTENATIVDRLNSVVVASIVAVRTLRDEANARTAALQDAEGAIMLALDSIAGTQELSLVVDVLQAHDDIKKKGAIQAIIEGLKEIRSTTEQFVGERMLEAISGDFGKEVMAWYEKIRTTGDPNVHFSGFDLKKTAQGNRVQIKAASYGKELVSAVSSLSESKLNALGLCMSIAINLTGAPLFDFLIIDDPIQSWDAEHEDQFINVVRELVSKGRQVIILSHNYPWITRMRAACEDLGGIYYEIASYDDRGPCIEEKEWSSYAQRMATISGIANNPNADTVVLQQAEEEFRHVVNQIAAAMKRRMFGISVSTANMNAEATKTILLECGVDLPFVNKIMSAFTSIDDSHHTPTKYTVNRERIRQYEEWAKTLIDRLKKAKKIDLAATTVT